MVALGIIAAALTDGEGRIITNGWAQITQRRCSPRFCGAGGEDAADIRYNSAVHSPTNDSASRVRSI